MNFNESFYLARNPDIAIAVNQGLIGTGWQHYLYYGRDEGRSTDAPDGYEFFNEIYYLANNPDVAQAVEAGQLIGSAGPTAFREGSHLPYLGEIALNLDAVESQISEPK